MSACVLRDVGVCALAIVFLTDWDVSLAGSILLSSSFRACRVVLSFSFSCPLLLLHVLGAAPSAAYFSLLSCDAGASLLVLSENLVGMVAIALLISLGVSDNCCFFEGAEFC